MMPLDEGLHVGQEVFREQFGRQGLISVLIGIIG
jgi:hypothetical protein